MHVVIEGHDLPGRQACGHADVHVGLRVRNDIEGLVPAHVDAATWSCEVDVRPGLRDQCRTHRTCEPRSW